MEFRSFYENSTVFVTGGTGFIGSRLVRALVKSGAHARCLKRKESNLWRLEDMANDIEFIEGDLANEDGAFWEKATEGASLVFHLGADGVHYERRRDWKGLTQTNVLGTMALLCCAAPTVKRFVAAGTSAEYGDSKNAILSSSDPLSPFDLYGATKAASSLIVPVAAREKGISAVVLRLFYVYGPYEMPPKLIPTLVKGALSGETVPLASGEEIRDFTYVEDIVEAFLRAGAREMAASEGKTLNLGSANVATVEEVARTIMELIPSNRGFCLNSLKHRREEAKFLIPETAEAWDFLGWSPAHSLRDGLKKTIAWFDACRR